MQVFQRTNTSADNGGQKIVRGLDSELLSLLLKLSRSFNLFPQFASVVRHTDGHLCMAVRARVTFSRMSEAFAVQMKGFGFLLW